MKHIIIGLLVGWGFTITWGSILAIRHRRIYGQNRKTKH